MCVFDLISCWKVALEKQRQEYERQFQQLRNILSPSTPYSPYVPYDPLRGSQSGKLPACTPTTQMRVEKWAQERDEMFKRSLGQLKTDILKANALVQEANVLAEEMGKQTKFSVTLQIPPNNLSPNRKVKHNEKFYTILSFYLYTFYIYTFYIYTCSKFFSTTLGDFCKFIRI